ncbi:cryptochrome/photolyase family protein [Labrys monachus]|uniref:Deoxyribodipyrimidine photo-lyase n=1 Tax=Labrys monachus TaxID=217067 RepID=A0ABU0FK90_9HYPH|nr:deoxyribodipyrimidine photo-lyase [Labrys monachus]MDQ0395032.1 deoxyribodipyrimidine photo-lyase [Labrys monachus]
MTVSDVSPPAIMWFRNDLRLADNPALHAAAASARPLICVYVHEDGPGAPRPPGGAARWWLHGALAGLDRALANRGGALHLLRGPAEEAIAALATAVGAAAVYRCRRYDEPGRAIDARLDALLEARGVASLDFSGTLLHEPWAVENRSGQPFRVFTPFWRASRQRGAPGQPLRPPERLSFFALPEETRRRFVGLGDLGLEPAKPDWAGGLRTAWRRDEDGAAACLDTFLDHGLEGYAGGRDHMASAAISRLSPYLRFGQVSVRQVWHAVTAARLSERSRASEGDVEKFLAELGWREFAYHLLHQAPDLARRNLQPRFDAMRWRSDERALRAWQRGETGYPLVDAGMRQLWATGWMHNRVRMVTASFLAKHLLLDWREGEAWFWDTLVDADVASNPVNWQWVAGSGADAAPYFRVLNPILQGEKFDAGGDYVRRWVPELACLPAAVIHRPWTAGKEQLAAAGVALGETYPLPIVAHEFARERALAAWRDMRA